MTSMKNNQIRNLLSSWLRSSNDVLVYVLIAIPFIAMSLATGLGFRFIGDEGFFHIRVIDAFTLKWPKPNIADYPSASTPLPYLLWTMYGKIVGFDIWKLRLFAVLVSYLAVSLFYSLCKKHDLPYPIISTLIFLFFPYIFFHAFTIYTVSFGLFFGIWALHYYLLNDPSYNQLLKGSLLATLAIYCRQYYLVLPVGMFIFEFWKISRRDFIPMAIRRFWHALILSLPMILVLPLFCLWQGVTPPLHQSDHFVRPVLQHLNFMPVFVGFYFFPLLIEKRSLEVLKTRKFTLVIIVILMPLFFLFPLVYSEEPNLVAAMTGLIAHGLDILAQIINSQVVLVIKFALWAIGLFIIMREIIDYPWIPVRGKLLALLTAFLILITLTPYVGERYYVLIIPYLILLLHRSFHNRGLLFLWLIAQVVLAMGFAYWQIALKSFDSWY